MKRRGFLGMFGAALAVGPEQIAKDAGIELNPLHGTGRYVNLLDDIGEGISGPNPTGVDKLDPAVWERKKLKTLRALRWFKPAFFEQKRRDDAKRVYELDLNIASLRSCSLAGKVAMQRELNYHKNLLEEEDSLKLRLEEKFFDDKLGFSKRGGSVSARRGRRIG